MVAIMALSVCSAVNLTTATKADAAVATKLTTSVSPGILYHGLYRGEQFTISGTLTTSDGTPLTNKAITVSWKASDGRTGTLPSVKTDSQGRYARTDSAKVSPQYLYTVAFAGDATYARASATLTINVGLTETSIASTNYKPLRNQVITLVGHVVHVAKKQDGTGKIVVRLPPKSEAKPIPKSDKSITGQVTVYRRVADGHGGWTAWKAYKKATLTPDDRSTDITYSNWSTTAYGYTLDTQFKAVYPGCAYFFGSESQPIPITGFGVD